MSMGRATRWPKERIEPVPSSSQWPGDLSATSCIGKQALSRSKSAPRTAFDRTAKLPQPKSEIPIHVYDVPQSTLQRQGTKWMPQEHLAHQEMLAQKKEQEAVVGVFAQYPGRGSGAGGGSGSLGGVGTDYLASSRMRSAPSFKFPSRPPTSLIEPEAAKLNAHHMANPLPTFGRNERGLSRVPSSPSVVVPRGPRETPTGRRASIRSPTKQWPAGPKQTQSVGPQVLSTRATSSRALVRSRSGGVCPLPRQWTSQGPGMYMPPSTFAKAGTALPANLAGSAAMTARAQTATTTSRRSRGPPKLSTSASSPQLVTLKEWHTMHPRSPIKLQPQAGKARSRTAAPSTRRAKKRGGGGGGGGGSDLIGPDGRPRVTSLAGWLETFGGPSKRSMFTGTAVTRRAERSRGLSRGLRTRDHGMTPEKARAALQASLDAEKERKLREKYERENSSWGDQQQQ